MRRRSGTQLKENLVYKVQNDPTWICTYFLEKLFVKIHGQNKDIPIVLWMAYQSR